MLIIYNERKECSGIHNIYYILTFKLSWIRPSRPTIQQNYTFFQMF